MNISVVLVEDHKKAREAIIELLNAEPDINVVGAAGTAADGMRQIESCGPDIAVVDVQLPDGNGIALCRDARAISPRTRCIVHTSIEVGPETASYAGIAAVVLKQLSGNELVRTIRTTANVAPGTGSQPAGRPREAGTNGPAADGPPAV